MSVVFGDVSAAKAVSYGSGRFLRCVLVPALSQLGVHCVVAQARSTYVIDMLKVGNTKMYIHTHYVQTHMHKR